MDKLKLKIESVTPDIVKEMSRSTSFDRWESMDKHEATHICNIKGIYVGSKVVILPKQKDVNYGSIGWSSAMDSMAGRVYEVRKVYPYGRQIFVEVNSYTFPIENIKLKV